MTKRTHIIAGRVVEPETGHGVAGLRVEAWDKDLVFDDLVGSNVTDSVGAFRLEFEASHFRELFLDRRPDLFFKVFDGDRLLRSTEDAVLWNTDVGDTDVMIVLRPGHGAGANASQDFVVSGQARTADGEPLANVTVRAFDRSIGREALLGEAATDSDGAYRIAVSSVAFLDPARGAPHLVVRALGVRGRVLRESPVILHAASPQTLDLVLDPVEDPALSRYEAMVAALDSLLGGHRLSALAESDLEMLAAETPFDVGQIRSLQRSERLAAESGLPAVLLFATGRAELPLELERVLALDDGDLVALWERSAAERVIPRPRESAVDAALRRLAELRVGAGLLTRYEVTGRLEHPRAGSTPAGYAVRVVDLDARPREREVGVVTTDRSGEFGFTYTTRPDAQDELEFRLHVLDRAGAEQRSVRVGLVPGQDRLEDAIEIPVLEPGPSSPEVAELAETLRLDLAPDLLSGLERAGITTLDDIRTAGGVARISELEGWLEDASLKRLQAHADLGTVSADLHVNETLIAAGYDSPYSIVLANKTTFVSDVADELGEDEAEGLHEWATSVRDLVVNAITSWRVYGTSDGSAPANGKKGAPELEDETAAACDCEACNSAASPGAYLADLLDYTLKHVAHAATGQALDLGELSDTFHVPFADLGGSCSASEAKVKQIRLLIDVLRGATRNLPAGRVRDWLELYEREYRDRAYETLLVELGTSYQELRQARGYATDERAALAARLGFEAVEGALDRIDALTLDAGDRSEATLEKLFGLPPTSPPPAVTGPGTLNEADVLAWRLAFLRIQWRRSDWQLDLQSWHHPVVDPDLLGPDDFRDPSAAVGSPFALWVQRRDQVDGLLSDLAQDAPDLSAMLDRTYGAPHPDFDGLATQIREGAGSEIGAAVLAQTGLDVDAFNRFVELREVAVAAALPPESHEWAELASILAHAKKRRDPAFYPAWAAEESAAGIGMDARWFWQPLEEPQVGAWPLDDADSRALVDPEPTAPTDLRPVMVAGETAEELWRIRAEQLDTLVRGLDDLVPAAEVLGMVRLALGLADTEASIEAELDPIHASLGSLSAAQAQILDEKYHLSEPDLAFLWDVRARAGGAVPGATPPSATDWTQLIAILKTAYKAAAGWKSAEGPLKYWEVLRAALPPWRAAPGRRRAWQAALTARSRPPIIDPAFFAEDDFTDPLAANPARLLFAERGQWIGTERDGLRTRRLAAGDDVAWLDQELEGIGVRGAELALMSELAPARLAQVGLSRAAAHRLHRLRGLLDSGQPLDTLEVQEIESILVRARMPLHFGAWNAEEQAAQVILSPDFFQIGSGQRPNAVVPWLGSTSARRAWEKKLKSRIGQEEATLSALESAVGAAQDAALPLLRKGLVYAAYMQAHPVPDIAMTSAHTPDTGRYERSKWVTRHFLIDSEEDPCRETTRIQQAVETIQGLLWSIRSGLLLESGHEFELDDPDRFDREWRWLGSYASWRAAMMAFIYPENILLPSLRSDPTPGFRALVGDLRLSGRIGPDDATTAAEAYGDYWLDVLDLQVAATVGVQYGFGQPDGILMFGRGSATQRVYFSTMRADSRASYWALVPGLEEIVVDEVIGAARYRHPMGSEQVHLFVKGRQGGEPGVYLRTFELDLAEGSFGAWTESEAVSLGVDRSPGWHALLALKTTTTTPPALLVWGGSEGLELRQLNAQGTDWDASGDRPETDFSLFEDENGDHRPMVELTPLAIVQRRLHPVEVGLSRFFLVASDPAGSPSKGLRALDVVNSNIGYFGFHRDARRLEGVGDWRGAYYWAPSGGDRVVAFRRSEGELRYTSWDLDQAETVVPVDVELPTGSWGFDISWSNTRSGSIDRRGLDESTRWARSAEAYGEDGNVYLAAQVPVEHPGFTGAACRDARVLYSVSVSTDSVETSGPLAQLIPPSTRQLPAPAGLDRAADWYQRGQVESSADFNSQDPDVYPLSASRYGSPSARNRTYLQEAFYYVPILLALKLQQSGNFVEALDWFRKVYDYAKPRSQRVVLPTLDPTGAGGAADYERLADWLLDPLDIHKIAAVRPLTDVRFVLLAVIRCVLDYADAEFTRDTSESHVRARELYLLALALLDEDVLDQARDDCEQIIGELTIAVGEDAERPAWRRLIDSVGSIGYRDLIVEAVSEVTTIMSSDESAARKLTRAEAVYEKLGAEATTRAQHHTLGEALERNNEQNRQLHRTALATDWVIGQPLAFRASIDSAVRDSLSAAGAYATGSAVAGSALDRFVPAPRYTFCIPPNPVLAALRFHAELNLHKLRTCRNIAGVERALEPYAAPTDATSGIPAIGAAGQITLPGAIAIRPTQYRYSALVERARVLVGLAQQTEATLLSLFEKADAERYTALKARQDAGVARAGVRLQDLRAQESEKGVLLAELQEERAAIQQEHFSGLLEDELLWQEQWALGLLWTNAALQFAVGAIATGGAILAGSVAGGVLGSETGPGALVTALAGGGSAASLSMSLSQTAYSSISGGIATTSSALSVWASYERRRRDWELQESVARQDTLIGAQQTSIARDRVRITGQEREIASLQADHADDVIEFLNNKFTGVELYDWMGGVMEGVYRYFLQQATGMALLAENQLAFERQELPAAFVQSNYWDAPRESVPTGSDGDDGVDRRGLTGSARLLQDIVRMDQYAFETDQRKLQLTKTLSLARLDPYVFQQFRETGVAVVATPMALFDRDFPGHYLRLIKRVRTSVVALVPPGQGIRATLSTPGVSRVVIGDSYQKAVLNRGPESVALTSPMNATGLFELESQGQGSMLLPFEGLGVDTTWELRLPKPANAFDFSTVADVLLTIEYTALDSPAYREQVLQHLDRSVTADRPFSFRHQFADAWYDLHHPELVGAPREPLVVSVTTRREDFPPNISDLRIEHVGVYAVRRSGVTDELAIRHLHFSELATSGVVGGPATTLNGIVGTRQGNAGAWVPMIGKTPIGEWTLALEDESGTRSLLEDNLLEDILFVVTFGGETEPWPE